MIKIFEDYVPMKNWQIQSEPDILKDVWFNLHAA